MHVITREEIALVRLLNKFEYIFAGKSEGCPFFFFFSASERYSDDWLLYANAEGLLF